MEGPSRVSKGLWAEGMKERVGSAEGEGKTGDASVGRKGIDEGGREGRKRSDCGPSVAELVLKSFSTFLHSSSFLLLLVKLVIRLSSHALWRKKVYILQYDFFPPVFFLQSAKKGPVNDEKLARPPSNWFLMHF